MSKLKLQNLRKEYAANVVPVKNISIDVEDGEFLTLLGPSGCGKSTLLRLIAGLEPPTKGNIIIGDHNVNKIAPGDRNIAMVFQSYALYPHMSVAENIGAALKLRKIPSGEIKNRVTETAYKLGLENLLERKPGQLSGGQRQRVALARALVRDPDVFLLDEPLSNLDALLREQVRADLKQLFKEQNKPVVYVTHDQTEAMTLSSKVVGFWLLALGYWLLAARHWLLAMAVPGSVVAIRCWGWKESRTVLGVEVQRWGLLPQVFFFCPIFGGTEGEGVRQMSQLHQAKLYVQPLVFAHLVVQLKLIGDVERGKQEGRTALR